MICRSEISDALRVALEEATSTTKGGFVKDALIYGYPRLAGLLDDFFKRLHQETLASLNFHSTVPKSTQRKPQSHPKCQSHKISYSCFTASCMLYEFMHFFGFSDLRCCIPSSFACSLSSSCKYSFGATDLAYFLSYHGTKKRRRKYEARS